MIKSYSPNNILVLVGIAPIQSWNEIEIAIEDDDWTFFKGAYGGFTRLKRASVVGTITITLPRLSYDNTSLGILYTTLSDTLDVAGTVPIFILDMWNQPVYLMAQATMVKLPDVKFGKQSSETKWVFKGEFSLNSPAVISAFDAINAIKN